MLVINCLYLERTFFFLHSSMCDLNSTAPTFISTTNKNTQVFGFFCVGQEKDDKITFLKAKSCHPNWSPMNTSRYKSILGASNDWPPLFYSLCLKHLIYRSIIKIIAYVSRVLWKLDNVSESAFSCCSSIMTFILRLELVLK